MARIRKTEPCPCGSGQKYKYCCGAPEAAEGAGPPRRRLFLLTVLALTPLALAVSFFQRAPGEAANRVWSEEHGHWHDLDAPEPSVVEGEAAPAPEGAAPPGKVWSAEHGHWHDAASTEPDPQTPLWSEDEVVATPLRREPFRIQRPPGPAPEGKTWDDVHGHWH